MPTPYTFVTRWQTTAPITDVWQVITDSLSWPQWWSDFQDVQDIRQGDSHGLGSIRRYTLRSPFGYRLSFDLQVNDIKEPSLIAGQASGDLEGTGIWRLDAENGQTRIECHWKVHTTKPWMNMLAFILKPVFIYNHKKVMANGARNFAEKLGCEVSVLE